ncbi:MAG: hypothetical protein IKD92_10140 [Lachnospiraceae bacterium]|nr:hypothetical protein [Sarcina sp.]MBR2730198.1 hypothetical protein [Lachnospiraceae bacterium]
MIGDLVAWIFAAASVILLIAAERRRGRRRREYRSDLIREFSEDEDTPAGKSAGESGGDH